MTTRLGGSLVRARSVDRLGVSLARVFAERHTGYLRIVADGPLDETTGVLTVVDGVPVAAVAGDECGVAALDTLTVPGAARVETYRREADGLASLHDRSDCRVPPGAPAERLGDDELAARTRERAPADRTDTDGSTLLSFLDDDRRLETIRSEARTEARADADEWGLNGSLAEE
ncbi:MAG: hypothetical protein J07HB67_02446 [halophilic archaeon J07HB67]|nr:MAG: hypothetical protein J07HB67_02446 [halophilic archaeon J07HB67]